MKKFTLVLFVLPFLLGCVKNNPAPAWLKIESWSLKKNANGTSQIGELSHAFTNAQVFINDESIGIFELPIKLPVLDAVGNTKISIYPVVLNNGISATKKAYPFCEAYTIEAVLTQNDTLTVQPVTQYFAETQFWIEDFEDAAVKIDTDDNSKASLVKSTDPSMLKYGSYFGKIHLDLDKNVFLGYTTGKQFLPKGKEVYLEIDYRSTNSLLTGLIEVSASTIKDHINVQLNGQRDGSVVWKKIYIDLKEIVSGTPLAEYYEVSLSAQLDDGYTEGDIIFDNIKLVHF